MRVSHSVLASYALASEVTGWYDLPGPAECALLSPGVNDTYRVEAGGHPFILRIYRAGWRTPGEVQWELDLLLHLERAGVGVSVPLKGRDGALVMAVEAPEGTRPAVLFSHAPGKPLQYVAADGLRYGQAAARLHTAMDTFVTDQPRFRLDWEHLLEEPLRAIRPFSEWVGNWGYYADLAGL